MSTTEQDVPFVSLTGGTLDRLKEIFSAPVKAVPTPWPLWSDACQSMGGRVGFAKGWHILVAGASGGAKTFTALNIIRAAVEHGEKVALYSLEMHWTEVGARWLPMVGGEPAWKMAPGKFFSGATYDQAAERVNLARGELITNKEPIRTLSQILRAVRKNADAGVTVHVIDYLQLAWVKDAESIYNRVTEVSHEVRALALELQIVSIGLSQINRAGNGEESPRKEAMAGSSSLENDADQVLLLDHTKRKNVQNAEGKSLGWFGWAELAKNRHGPHAKVPIAFSSDTFRIRQRQDDEIDPDEIAAMKRSGR